MSQNHNIYVHKTNWKNSQNIMHVYVASFAKNPFCCQVGQSPILSQWFPDAQKCSDLLFSFSALFGRLTANWRFSPWSLTSIVQSAKNATFAASSSHLVSSLATARLHTAQSLLKPSSSTSSSKVRKQSLSSVAAPLASW